jgi:transposase
MHKKAYRASPVNCVDEGELARGRDGQSLVVGVDVGKYEMMAVARWSDGDWERPWRVSNPEQIGDLVGLLVRLAQSRNVTVALEPSGTYGDALRQALSDAGIPTQRVSPKIAHDYAEVFDGVPSQHDGKDAAVVAELAAHGKSSPWPYEFAKAWEQSLRRWVDWMDAQRQIEVIWLGRIEALLARHWPEATRILKKPSSATLLRALEAYGSPAALAADAQADARLASWGRSFLKAEKRQRLLASAAGTVGVRVSAGERCRIKAYAQRALVARRHVQRAQKRLRRLARGRSVLQAQGRAIGIGTACVLWAHLGNPRRYSSGAAYRKAMGLNLKERSSGIYQGQLKISKRGPGAVRRWLYLAALRLVGQGGLQTWYRAKQRTGAKSKYLMIAITRRLALAVYHVSVRQTVFDVGKLFPGEQRKAAFFMDAKRR